MDAREDGIPTAQRGSLCAGTATARCFDLIGTRPIAAAGRRLETKWFQPVRHHIRHKHLSERDHAFEKIFSSRNSR
jgi:hypothetical protein